MNALSFQQRKKRRVGKCFFCGESDYNLLDCHRIVEGERGGKYTDFNTLVVCSNHHRKIHAGEIKILGKYNSTSGRRIVRYLNEYGEERWENE